MESLEANAAIRSSLPSLPSSVSTAHVIINNAKTLSAVPAIIRWRRSSPIVARQKWQHPIAGGRPHQQTRHLRDSAGHEHEEFITAWPAVFPTARS
jgi:hypothetical protein